jgi:cobalt-zinc-cadmium resistance protein CzcA
MSPGEEIAGADDHSAARGARASVGAAVADENALRPPSPTRPEIATDPMGVEMSDVFVMLKPREAWRYDSKEELIEALRRAVLGIALGFSQPIELRVAELVSGVRSDVAVKIFGPDLEVLRREAEEVARAISTVSGASDVTVEQVSGLPILTAAVDRTSLARHGVSADEVLGVVEAMGGRQVGVILEGEKRFMLRVRFPERVRNDPAAIARVPVATAGGRLVPLGELVKLDQEPAASQISREAIQRRITVEANVRGRDIASFVDAAKEAMAARVKLPPGYTVAWGGQFENLERATGRLAVVVPLALLLIFVLLYGTFGAARPALLIFLKVPFAATGGVLARMRPVMTTALVAALGFVPMALATGAGAEMQRPLATVVIGGLVTATLLTLLVLPAIYLWFATTGERAAADGGQAGLDRGAAAERLEYLRSAGTGSKGSWPWPASWSALRDHPRVNTFDARPPRWIFGNHNWRSTA